ncbi:MULTISPECIES: hypothetical protein [Rhodococcus]|jgi:hypothetical protein|uniref:hypothetical protein n=1 Tax=Rhodococcus TaxID=1827 RepID=UPI000B27B380|nr:MULTISPECIES: hypothetical protein [Rhodococcus]MCF8786139.1 hypothetical protein [Rhodococcus ruber]UTM40281.1 hypothetical protein MX572_25580 [Rhodococcus pyridinivorans]WAL49728.1 hypothetical protein OQN32_27335 [Rhodococcus pyridinivorans]
MKTFARTRVPFSVEDIDCSISVGDNGLVQHALTHALRIALEAGGSAPGVDPLKICEALELFATIEKNTNGDTGQFLRTDYPMVFSVTGALAFARDVLIATAGNIDAGLCPVPTNQSPIEAAAGFRDTASWLDDIITAAHGDVR